MSADQDKVVRLEAARGLAALVVFIHHFFVAFAPAVPGYLVEDRESGSLLGGWYFFLFNGEAAVIFFFVLSGYVLCIKPLGSGDAAYIKLSLLRRWPRLVPLVTMSVLLSWACHASGLYFFQDAVRLSKTHWLEGWNLDVINPSFLDALWQGSFAVFFTGETYLNTNLWTMKREIIGSLYVFAMSALMLSRQRHVIFSIILVLLATAGLRNALFPFLLGFLLALISLKRKPVLAWPFRLGMLCLALYMLGYKEPVGDYSWVANMAGHGYLVHRLMLPLGGGVLLLYLLSGRVWHWLDGGLGRWFGELSFPFYVMHIIVIWSWSSWVYTVAQLPLAVNLVSSLMLTLLICIPLMWIDRKWVAFLKEKTRHIGLGQLAELRR